MEPLNPEGRCLACHCKLEDKYYFCSITCSCVAGYLNVRTDGTRKDMKELRDPEVRAKFLNNPPLRVREKYL